MKVFSFSDVFIIFLVLFLIVCATAKLAAHELFNNYSKSYCKDVCPVKPCGSGQFCQKSTCIQCPRESGKNGPCNTQCVNNAGCINGLACVSETCQDPPPKYSCENSTCVQKADGIFMDAASCELVCGNKKKYACINRTCQQSDVGTYHTLRNCLAACSSSALPKSDGTINKYKCDSTSKQCVRSSDGVWATQESCNASCGGTPSPPTIPGNVTKCPDQGATWKTCAPTECGKFNYPTVLMRPSRGGYWSVVLNEGGVVKFSDKEAERSIFVMEPIDTNRENKYVKIEERFYIKVGDGPFKDHFLFLSTVQARSPESGQSYTVPTLKVLSSPNDRNGASQFFFRTYYTLCQKNSRYPNGKGCPLPQYKTCFPAIFYEHCSLRLSVVRGAGSAPIGKNRYGNSTDWSNPYVGIAHNSASASAPVDDIAMLDAFPGGKTENREYSDGYIFNNNNAEICHQCPEVYRSL